MNLTLEKEKIKKEIDRIDDAGIIKAIKKLLAGYDLSDEMPSNVVSEPPIEDWEMATPLGRTPTPQQLEEWINKISDDEEELSGEEALKYSLKELERLRNKRK